jgi:Helix-turn-helix domain
MATITPIKHTPHTRIENTIIANMSEIGVYCYAVYCVIKMHLNQATGDCFPSYATIARITGIHRSTVIECVKKLKVLKLISPLWRFKEDGSHTTNQYNFQSSGKAGASTLPRVGDEASSPKTEGVVKTVQGGRPERPPLVGEDDSPSRPERPEQSESNKKKRTSEEVDFMVTEKQKSCSHPAEAIVNLSDNITICHHCYGLLDENLKLQEEENPNQSGEQPPVEIVAA